MNSLFRLGLFALLVLVASSCVVSKKKYDELLAQKTRLEQEKANCDSALTNRSKSLADLQKLHADLQAEAAKLRKDTTSQGLALRSARKQFSSLEKSYNQLLANSATEAAARAKDLKSREDEINRLNDNLRKTSEDLAAREKRVRELEKILADKDAAVQALREKVQKALLSFKDSELSVNIKNGKVYVSLSEQLLFKSGSYNVDPKGADALKKLADALKNDADINIVVEGHTDDVPLNSSTPGLRDNWDLSVLRATTIVRLLVKEGMPGTKLTAAGHGEFLPIAEGKTPEIRQKNRRTDIILSPKLDELFQILGTN